MDINRRAPLAAVITAGLFAQAWADNPAYRSFEGAGLTQGRVIWLDNCEGCHGYGIAGAPIPMEADQWRERLQKDQATLYRHAINGFYGPDDTIMPGRGGNPSLSDLQVRQAVDYMTALARYHLTKTETLP